MSMTLRQLIDELNDIIESDEDLADAPVLLAQQPNYPLAMTLDCITIDRCGHKARKYDDEKAPTVIWLAEGESVDYAPRHAWDGGEVDADEDDDEGDDEERA